MLKAHETSGIVLFEEKQRYPRWLNTLIIVIFVFTIVMMVIAGYMGTEEKRKETWLGLIIAVPVEVLVILLLRNLRLEKIVTSNGLYYRWQPWQKRYRVIEKEDIESFTSRRFPFVSYGFGWFPNYGWYHNAGGGEGMQLYLRDGRRYFFSTADKVEFEDALHILTSFNPKPSLREF